ncbi:hypothetical protein GS399_16610 [Pedobacter sp. HMF7647]|uniref:Uncharacterized protein n=1 Tax=Hufsiella arboris TaxID=2695275 RepID=A0A7K1YDC6_9SPHI|nr:hypothetical protein [Hufsiella arboris]MXV52597.1 hypothetical protein [Hufsiella arboris]
MHLLKFPVLRFIIILTVILITSCAAMAATGCNLGNDIYPNPSGNYFQWDNNVPYYTPANPIHIRFWNGDNQCGVITTALQTTGRQCIVNFGANQDRWGSEVVYSTSEQSCNVPLDDYVWLLFVAAGGFGLYKIKSTLGH